MMTPEYHGRLIDHLEELRNTLIYSFGTICCGFILALFFYQPIFHILVASYTGKAPLILLGPLAGLSLTFKICLWASLLITCPVWCWLWFKFVLPGLKSQEQALVKPLLMGSMISLAGGGLCGYWMTLPFANAYLLQFNQTIGVNAWTLNEYIEFVILIILGHCVAFEVGFLLLLLAHYQLISPYLLISFRRYAIVIAFVLGAFLTPPDIVTQLLMATPLILLYEITIQYAKWRAKIDILKEHEINF